jgi:hypothetical protein
VHTTVEGVALSKIDLRFFVGSINAIAEQVHTDGAITFYSGCKAHSLEKVVVAGQN